MVGFGLVVIGAVLLVFGSMMNTGVPTPSEVATSVRLTFFGTVVLASGLFGAMWEITHHAS